MKLFRCQACGQVLYFENVRCERCARRLGYLPDVGLLSALDREEDTGLAAALEELGYPPDAVLPPPSAAPQVTGSGGTEIWNARVRPDRRYRFCANAAYDACNWLVPAEAAEAYCTACRHNRIVPDLSQPANLPPWRRLEAAKHRLFYTLLRLGLPLANRADDPERGLAIDVLADPPEGAGPKVMTGHAEGVVTIALAEGDDAERTRRRAALGELYRTPLGHFRHETAHYYWDRLVRDDPGRLEAFRALFGDERRDYATALQAHYANGAPPDWQEKFVSAYAATHPWEDFAETWAHYLHIVDTLETANAFGLRVRPKVDRDDTLSAEIDFDPHLVPPGEVGRLVEAWLPLAFAVNSLNRSMGEQDLYPFILSPAAIGKLGFIHDLVHAARTA